MGLRQLRFYLFTVAAMLLIPSTALAAKLRSPTDEPASSVTESSRIVAGESSATTTQDTVCYRVLDVTTGTVTEVPLREYLIGVVCAEMPATFEIEALKAQAVAAHTYAERISRQNRETPDPALFGADFSNDSSVYQAYYTESQIRNAFGDSFTLYYNKVAEAVDAVCDQLLYYEDEPIIAAFHAMCPGKTENAETVWGAPLAYLVSVDSASDTDAPSYLDTTTFTAETVSATLTAAAPSLQLPEDQNEWLQVQTTSEAGTVLRVQCGNHVWSGQQIRELFSLRSACFTVAYNENGFTFTTKGYGHAVGMSQYGANAMAAAGCNYAEILAHYYPNTTLQ